MAFMYGDRRDAMLRDIGWVEERGPGGQAIFRGPALHRAGGISFSEFTRQVERINEALRTDRRGVHERMGPP